MAEEVLTPDTLVADNGVVLSFSGGTFDIADFRYSDQNTGLTIGANGSSIDFSMSDPTLVNFTSAIMKVIVTINGANTKNVIGITALDDSSVVGVILGNEGTGTFSFDITSLGLERIKNTNFRIEAAQAITNISEVSITLSALIAGKATISSGKLSITSGKVTL